MRFTKKELDYINRNEVCRLATASDNSPHVVPVCYIYDDGHFYIATDYGTRKYRNLTGNRRVSLVVDSYKPNRAVMIQGEAEIIESGEEFRRIYDRFYMKFSWVRAEPWSEGEAPFVKVRPVRKVSWGL